MINDRVTEFQVQSQEKWWKYHQESGLPTGEDKHFAGSVVHDGHIMQGFADGYIEIIGHGGQEKKFCHSKHIGKK